MRPQKNYEQRGLNCGFGWDNTKTTIMASRDGFVGVLEHIKGRIGKHGNTGEPNVYTRATR